MQNTQLFRALQTLTATERRGLERFVQSPFFNRSDKPVFLLDYLDACLSQKQEPSSETAFEKTFPKQPYDDAKLRLVSSVLLSLLEKYLVFLENEADEARNSLRLATAWRKRGAAKPFHAALRDAHKDLEKQPWRHAGFYASQTDLEWERYQFASSERRTGELNLQAVSDNADVAFCARKLQLACLALSHQSVYQADYQLDLLVAALDFAARHPHIPALGLYYHCYRFLSETGDAENDFRAFNGLLREHSDSLPPDEQRTLFLLAINFGIRKLNTAGGEWPRATLSLYQNALERGLLLENGRLSRFAFNNMVAIALRLDELAWAETFILNHKQQLERNYRETTASLNLARVSYARRDLATALQNLQFADYKDLINNLIAKTLQLKIYYETGEYNLLESHLSSMKNYIRRHTTIGYHRSNYSRIVYFTEKLMALNFREEKAVEELRRKIAEEPLLSEKIWLLEMLNDK